MIVLACNRCLVKAFQVNQSLCYRSGNGGSEEGHLRPGSQHRSQGAGRQPGLWRRVPGASHHVVFSMRPTDPRVLSRVHTFPLKVFKCCADFVDNLTGKTGHLLRHHEDSSWPSRQRGWCHICVCVCTPIRDTVEPTLLLLRKEGGGDLVHE